LVSGIHIEVMLFGLAVGLLIRFRGIGDGSLTVSRKTTPAATVKSASPAIGGTVLDVGTTRLRAEER
jgi:hypothetical protein